MTALLSRSEVRVSLNDVADFISRSPLIAPLRRGEILSAIRTVERVLGMSLDELPADPRLLAGRLTTLSPEACGLSKGRWANVLSLLRTALRTVGPVLPGRIPQPMTLSWEVLHSQLGSRSHRMRLSRILRWLSQQQIGPESVTEDHLQSFKHALLNDALIKNPDAAWRETASSWNTACRTVDGWPNIPIIIERYSNRYSLPWSAFPLSLKLDVDAYLDRLSGADPLEELSHKPVRISTRETREWQMRGFASGLVHSGVSAADLGCLADLVAPERFKTALRFFLDRHGGKPCSTIEQMANALKAVARHWVKVLPAALEQINKLVKRVTVGTSGHGLTEKNRARLRAFDDPQNVIALVTLPQRLMKEADSGRYLPLQAALLAQVAVAIELLLMQPIRISNLCALELGRHILRASRARKTTHIVIPGDEVKNGRPLEYGLPLETVELVEHYLARYCPLLCGPENTFLFPGKGKAAKAKHTLGVQISRVIKQYTGLDINPHLFRHIAAKLHLDANPGDYGTISQLLGHASLQTVLDSYTGLETAAAVRKFDKTIQHLRDEGFKAQPKRRRGGRHE